MPPESIEAIFTTLHNTATFDGHQPHVHLRSNALCARLEVETRRDGVVSRATFSRGRVLQSVQRQGQTSERGTVIRLLPDDDLFEEGVRVELEALESWLERLAWLSPRLDLRFQGRSLQRPGGLPGWVQHLAPEVVKETVLSAVGTVNDVQSERCSSECSRVWWLSFTSVSSTPDFGGPTRARLETTEASVAVEQVVTRAINEAPWWWDRLHEALA